MKQEQLNETYSKIEGDIQTLKQISDFLKVERPGAWFEPAVKSGYKSPYHYFTQAANNGLIVMNGHLDLLSNFGISGIQQKSEFTELEIDEFLKTVVPKLPFEPYDFQIKAFKESILNKKQINKMCTSSGKSLTISLIAEFFRVKGKRGLLLVPNINLLTQFKSDIEEYNLKELFKSTHVIGGGQTDKHFNSTLTISTWQSLHDRDSKLDLNELDYVMCDELHRFASSNTGAIVKETSNCNYKLGFTGTLPEDPIMKMELLGMFGFPKTYITSKELIDRGLGTPIFINSILLKYTQNDRNIFKEIRATGRSKNKFPNQLQFIKDHQERSEFLNNFIVRLRPTGNNLVLFQHTEHGKQIFYDVMKMLYPDVEVQNKDITGKKSFEFQSQYRVYFLNGEDNAKTREETRLILNENSDAILIANYAILSTGVNIRKLHNMVLASPMKSYTTVTQSIGRLMRKHPEKSQANVYDIIDDFGVNKPSGPFYKQYLHRLKTSYYPEEYPIKEVQLQLK